jgi:hypothetical protein
MVPRYAGIGRLDGYRVGRWQDFASLVLENGKAVLFPKMAAPYVTYTGSDFVPDDYFVLYDDTVYGEGENDTGGWDSLIIRYIGMVRAINIFNGDSKCGTVIIEYFTGGCPIWDVDIADGQRSFFGVYYRVLASDMIQMANAVDLAALYAGKKYSAEIKTLGEAVELNSAETEAEFTSWGV